MKEAEPMKDAIRAKAADAVDVLTDLDAMLEHRGDRLPPLIAARLLVQLDGIGRRLKRLHRAATDAAETHQTPPPEPDP
jgi:hypothetical protein